MQGEAPVLKAQSRTLQQSASSLTDAEVAIKVLPEYAEQNAMFDFMQEINFMKVSAYLIPLIYPFDLDIFTGPWLPQALGIIDCVYYNRPATVSID